MKRTRLAVSLFPWLFACSVAAAPEATPPSRPAAPAAPAARTLISDPKVQETPADDGAAPPPAHRSRTLSSERAHGEPRKPAARGDGGMMAAPVIVPQIRLPAGAGTGSAAGSAAKGAGPPTAGSRASVPGRASGSGSTGAAGSAAAGSAGAHPVPSGTPATVP